ncbi:MAG: HEAT repeat domain-containing protein [Methanoregula sp.]|nr:MAG: HEAT repeat domain-containing protein [Methanoregula sp.]
MVSKRKKKSKIPVHNKVEPARVDTAVPLDIPAEKSVEQLIQELNDPDEIVRSTAAGALGHRKAEKAVEPLIQALHDKHVWVRHGAAWALGEIKPETAIDALRLALNDEDEITRGKAAEALGKIQGN